jgi:hypothetical protein
MLKFIAIFPEPNIDKLVKSPKTVMPDLIRHPEVIEFTGFRLGRHPGPRSGTE